MELGHQLLPLFGAWAALVSLYLILDSYRCKIIAEEVHDYESGYLLKQLIGRALLRESYRQAPPVLYSDKGTPMTSYILRARLAELDMLMSHS